jgi:peptide/nickel transport system substrate-binding protein
MNRMTATHPDRKEGKKMRRKLLWPLAVALLVALPFAASACGGDDDGGDDTAIVAEEFTPLFAAPDDAQEGGELKVLANGDVDYMDPGAAFYQFSYMFMDAMHRKLLHYAPEDIDPIPDGAAEEPEISDDGKMITFTIRDGMMFAPPVDREVVAADYEYAIERGLLPGVANGYISGYLGDVAGFEQAQKEAADNPTGGAPDIEGVTAVDDRTLEIELDESTALAVIGALSLPLSAPVPEEYAKEFDAENPSTYGDQVAFSGPYMVENDPETGELTGYTPGKEIHLVRNPNWDPETDFRPAYLDEITVQEGFTDTTSASRKILSGSASVNGDINPPPQIIEEATALEGQLVITPAGGGRWVAMNTQEPPFDDINVRKAVIANSNRVDLRNTFGGELVGPVATHFLPPEFPGFEEAGGLEGPDLDFLANPEGDPELAAEYMQKAGYESGKCEGSECQITMFGEDGPPDKEAAEVARSQFEELGFEVDFRLVDPDILYTRFCNVPAQSPDVCPNVGWIKDFNDAQSFLDLTFNGENILPANNSNWPQLDVPEINKAMNEAALLIDRDERAEAWAEVDEMVTAQAPAIPWIWDNEVNIQSEDVVGVITKYNAVWDLSFTSLAQ